jgi:osmoprotectant transport system permease protein
MFEDLRYCLDDLPSFLGGHMLLSVSGLAVGLVLSIPLGIWASRRPRVAEIVLGAAGIIQTIPSLALLALMVPLLRGTIGFLPAFIALILYSILPIVANTIVGIRGVDPTLTEAARGLGMNDRQMLLRVELPLAAPVIIGGIRTAAVLVVGTATLATPVGVSTLGNYIFSGLELRNPFFTLFGCIAAALLAVIIDQLIHALELAARRRSRTLALVGGLGLLLVVFGGLYAPLKRFFMPPANPAIVGHGPFTEQYILGELLTERLKRSGWNSEQHRLGETILFQSLLSGEIDCYVDYSGNIWTLEMKRPPADRRTVLEGVKEYLARRGVVCMGSLGFENAYALAMTRKKAAELKIKSLDDLRRHAARLKVGGDNQIFLRQEWRDLCKTYHLQFESQSPMDPTFMYGAVADGKVDVITAYTSDGRIKTFDLVILEEDPARRVFPPYDALLLVSGKAARRPGFQESLRPLLNAIDVETMRRANERADVEGHLPHQVGVELLDEIETKKKLNHENTKDENTKKKAENMGHVLESHRLTRRAPP